jgi:hypothetical protein
MCSTGCCCDSAIAAASERVLKIDRERDCERGGRVGGMACPQPKTIAVNAGVKPVSTGKNVSVPNFSQLSFSKCYRQALSDSDRRLLFRFSIAQL